MLAIFGDCAILYPVSERNMKNQMTMAEIRRHFNLRTRREAMRREAKRAAKRPTNGPTPIGSNATNANKVLDSRPTFL